MRRMICWFLALLSLPVLAKADSARVIAAAATSSAPKAATVTCLLQSDCANSWSPGSADSGANEGVYVQFEKLVDADTVVVVSNSDAIATACTLSINGAVATAGSSAKRVSDGSGGRFAMRYPVPGHRVKSVYFRLGVRKGGWYNFSLYSIQFYLKGNRLDLVLPVVVTASVDATSVLEPKVAYQPANLFDSRYDYAWSTNGKTTTGKGESVDVKFNQPQNLAGMIIWNGYQRSEEHFRSNGRVARIAISAGEVSQIFSLNDRMGGQTVAFGTPLRAASSVKLTIEEITPGTKYPDVLISELRFIDDHNQIVIPQVTGMLPNSSPLTEPLVDRSFSSMACSSSVSPTNFQRSLRLRHDGSFVIYGKSSDEEGTTQTDQVLEGNWELRGGEIRIFGKRYSDTIVQQDYSQSARRIPPSIFQSDLKVTRFRDLTSAEKQQLASLIWSRLTVGAAKTGPGRMSILGAAGAVLASGPDEKSLLTDFVRSLDNMNPWTFRSPVLADAMLPSDDIGPCE
jgi:hypothetical protein